MPATPASPKTRRLSATVFARAIATAAASAIANAATPA
jgi:hypothetical protein